MREKFYICRHCGNLIGLIHDAGVPMMCCGQKMEALVPNTTEAWIKNTCLMFIKHTVLFM